MDESANNMKTMLVNINGFSQHSKIAPGIYIENEQIDVLCLCETDKLMDANCSKNFQSCSCYKRKGVRSPLGIIKGQQKSMSSPTIKLTAYLPSWKKLVKPSLCERLTSPRTLGGPEVVSR